MKPTILTLLLLTSALAAPTTLQAKLPPSRLDPPRRTAVVEAVLSLVQEQHLWPEAAARMDRHVRQLLRSGAYESIGESTALAERLTDDLRSVGGDRQIRVRFGPPVPIGRPPAGGGSGSGESAADETDLRGEWTRRGNAGFVRMEVLNGNTGYLKIDALDQAAAGGSRLDAAIQFLGGTDALILDLRDTRGERDAGLFARLCTYLLPGDRTPLSSRQGREGERREELWTLPALPGSRYLDRPVFVLTSGTSGPAAEELAYTLQALGRVTVVGEVTPGAALAGSEAAALDHFQVWIPQACAVHPLTSRSWLRTGVQPDTRVAADRALSTAHRLALEASLASGPTDLEWNQVLRRELARLQQELQPAPRSVEFELSGFPRARDVSLVGTFNAWTPGVTQLERDADRWVGRVPLDFGEHRYQFWVDGRRLPDPRNPVQTVDAHGRTNSIIRVSPS
jgi:hypothetical protein